MTRIIYSLCIFLGSFLLFLIQPMVGKILLPCLGGVPAVWTTCMLFFQTALLAGYVYAEKSIRLLGCQRQSVIHLMLMVTGFLLLPVDIDTSGAEVAFNNPTFWLLSRLTGSIGFLFFIVSANAPLIQRYYSRAGQSDSADPYFLYSASNIGSLLALLAFPFAFEPLMTGTSLRYVWSTIYVIQTLLVFGCCLQFWQKDRGACDQPTGAAADPSEQQKLLSELAPGIKDKLYWVLLGFLPCSAMLGVTTHIATDIASGPLLWIFPLSLYLISFILVFAKSPRWRDISWENYMFPAIVMALIMYGYRLAEPVWLAVPFSMLVMFLVCMCFHSRLAKERPATAHLNSYFVWMSVGGIAGGLFNGVFAPLAFSTQAEYAITLIVAGLLVSVFSKIINDKEFSYAKEAVVMVLFLIAIGFFIWLDRRATLNFNQIGLFLAILVMAIIHLFYRFRKASGYGFAAFLIIFVYTTGADPNLILIDRSFFGILKVSRLATDGQVCDPDLKIAGVEDVFYVLRHGTTLHGVERKVDVRPVFPLAYYSREGPVGNVFRAGLINRRFKSIGVVGLGCGTIAWYGRPWQHMDFFEIDPKVVEIAWNTRYFSYLSSSRASIKTIVGDARINLQLVPDETYDILVIDAYSSDSVPVHLMTLEAFELYQKKLKKNGVLLLHISNRYFKLAPVIKLICDQLGMKSIRFADDPKKYSMRYDWYDLYQVSKSDWVMASEDEEKLKMMNAYGDWKEIPRNDRYRLWTDDYANMLQVYNWR